MGECELVMDRSDLNHVCQFKSNVLLITNNMCTYILGVGHNIRFRNILNGGTISICRHQVLILYYIKLQRRIYCFSTILGVSYWNKQILAKFLILG